MKKKILRIVVTLAVLALGVLGALNYPFLLDYGVLKDSVYTNRYFHMKVPLQGWFPVDMEKLKWMAERQEFLAKNPNSEPPKQPAAHRCANIHLIMAYDRPPTSEDRTFNPSFFIFAEKTAAKPRARSARQYLQKVSEEMAANNPNSTMRVPDGVDEGVIDGKKAARMRVEYEDAGKVFRQEYYAFKTFHYFLSFVLTWESVEQRARLQILLDSIHFKL